MCPAAAATATTNRRRQINMHDGKIDEDAAAAVAGDTIKQQVTSSSGFLRADYVVLMLLCVYVFCFV